MREGVTTYNTEVILMVNKTINIPLKQEIQTAH